MKPRQRITTADGSHSIFSNEFGVSYHSIHGAIQETQHVFINAGLKLKALTESEITILDVGLGTGLNAFMTYLEGRKKNLPIHYFAVEAYPLSEETILSLNYPELVGLPEDQILFELIHQSPWEQWLELSPNFRFQKTATPVQDLEHRQQFDLIYYDAFAPDAQPELWETHLMEKMYSAMKPDGVLVTYCAKGSFKRSLKAAGFTVEAIPGPPGKREMTRALKL